MAAAAAAAVEWVTLRGPRTMPKKLLNVDCGVLWMWAAAGEAEEEWDVDARVEDTWLNYFFAGVGVVGFYIPRLGGGFGSVVRVQWLDQLGGQKLNFDDRILCAYDRRLPVQGRRSGSDV